MDDEMNNATFKEGETNQANWIEESSSQRKHVEPANMSERNQVWWKPEINNPRETVSYSSTCSEYFFDFIH